jgi:adenylate kinase
MKLVLTAVPGAGKSTICNHLKEKNKDLIIANYGDYIIKIAEEMFPNKIKKREDVRKIPRKEYKDLQIQAAYELNKIKGNIIIDTHLSLKTPTGFYPGLIPTTLEILNPDIIVILEFNPRDVIKRRELDRKRGIRNSRDNETEKEIIIHQKINRIYGISYSARIQSYLKIIDLTWKQKYNFEHTEFAVNEINKLLKKW